MAFTAGLTSGLTEPITKALLEDYFYGKLTLEQMVAALGSTLWLDATETYAKSKVAVDLDGSADYLQYSGTSIGPTYTIAGWFEYPSAGHILDSQTNRGICSIGANIPSDTIGYWDNGSWRTSDSGSITVGVGNWYHLVWVLDFDANTVYFYVNGVSKGSGAYNTSITFTDFKIGSNNSGTSSFFGGSIDQYLIFNKALSSTEISTLYNSGDGLHHKDLDGTETFYGNIVAWYDFNTPPNFGRNYAEESHAVSLDGGANRFTSASSDFQFGADGTIGNEPSFSGVAWIKKNSNGSSDTICGNDGQWYFYDFGGNLIFGIEDVSYGTGLSNWRYRQYTTPLTVGEWYHVAFTYDGSRSNTGIKLYVNGSEVVSNAGAGGSYDAMEAGTQFGIGKASVPAFFDGVIDEVAIYSDELTSGEVSTLYNGGVVAPARTLHTDNLVSDWSFNAQNVADIGKDSYGSNDLTPTSIVEADLVGGKDSLDLLEVNITSANVTDGHIEGKAAGYDGVTLVTGRSGGVNAQQLTITEIATWYTDNYIRFTGSDNLDTTANIDLSGDFTIICRCRQSNIAESCDLLSTNTTIWNNNTSGKDVVLGVTATEAHTQNKWQTISIKSDSGTISFRKSKLPNGSGTRNATVVTSTTMTISDITMAQNFDLRGLFVVERALPDSDIALVEEYFQTLDVETLEVELSEVGVEVILEQLRAVTFKELGVEIVFEEV